MSHLPDYALPESGSDDIFISFCIPVYNAGSNLVRTLDSIVSQDDGHIEIICVNDGSTDGSGRILEEYSAKYHFLTVVNQRNHGITVTRNTALEKAVGRWVCFVDDDDILASGALQVFHRTENAEAEVLYYDYAKFTTPMPDQSGNELGSAKSLTGASLEKLQADCINRFAGNVPLISHKTLPTPWAKLYRRDFLIDHNLRFRPEVRHEEDVVFNFEVLSYCHDAEKIEYVSYYYRWSIHSESHRYRPDLLRDVVATLDAYADVIKRRYPHREEMKILYQYRVLWELLYCVVLGPIQPKNPLPYRERRAQFMHLLETPIFAGVLADRRIKTTQFEFKQSVLATLIRLRWFWLLNRLGGLVGKSR